jgi:hypothetical protein
MGFKQDFDRDLQHELTDGPPLDKAGRIEAGSQSVQLLEVARSRFIVVGMVSNM